LPASGVPVANSRANPDAIKSGQNSEKRQTTKGVRDKVGVAAVCRAPEPWRNALSLPRPRRGIDPFPVPSAVAVNRNSRPPAQWAVHPGTRPGTPRHGRWDRHRARQKLSLTPFGSFWSGKCTLTRVLGFALIIHNTHPPSGIVADTFFLARKVGSKTGHLTLAVIGFSFAYWGHLPTWTAKVGKRAGGGLISHVSFYCPFIDPGFRPGFLFAVTGCLRTKV